jgi:hypothetical protein
LRERSRRRWRRIPDRATQDKPTVLDLLSQSYIWGTGSTAENFLDSYPDASFLGFIDNRPVLGKFRGAEVYNPNSIDIWSANIVVASEFDDEIVPQAISLGAGTDNIRRYFDLLLEDLDGVVYSHQKAGRTWVRMMLGRLWQRRLELPVSEILRITASPVRFKAFGIPSVGFHHDDAPHRKLASQLEQKKTKWVVRRTVVLQRDPRAIAVSNYNHMRFRAKSFDGTLNDYVVRYFHSILTYYQAWSREEGVITVRYEDFLGDCVQTLGTLTSYLYPKVNFSSAELEDAVQFASLENMKAIENNGLFADQILAPRSDPRAAKVRFGEIDGWKQEMPSVLNKWCAQEMQAYGVYS